MSLPLQFIGLYHLDGNSAADPNGFIASLVHAAGPASYQDAHLVLFGCEQDRWPGPSMAIGNDAITVLLGDPLLIEGCAEPQARSQALATFRDTLSHQAYDCLLNAHGSYCGLNYNKATGALQLFTDKIGIRGVFVARVGDTVLFSSTPTLLMEIVEPHSAIDQTGITETLAFGFPLADRTRLELCKRLFEAEIVECRPGNYTRQQYHRWGSDIDQDISLDEAADRANKVFLCAVNDRLKATGKAEHFAFLSGGMDSRLIVNALCSTSAAAPITLNVAPADTLDAKLGNRAASFFQTNHYALPASSESLLLSLDQGVARIQAEHPGVDNKLWWSGDGGSVGLGYVYLTEKTGSTGPRSTESLAQALIEHNNWRISERALKNGWRHLGKLPLQGVVDELKRYAHLPVEKQAFAFLLFNDQRRHLDKHFASLEQRSFDLILPFFDDRFVQQILNIPTAHLLLHRLYNKLFSRHFPANHDIPWQAYPGHEPCPFPDDTSGRYQWDEWADRSSIRSAQKKAAGTALRTLVSGKTPEQVSSLNLLLASLITYSGARDMRYVLEVSEHFKDKR